ncbi:MAG TPA: AAA domain-containing protein, partial [Methanocorpusculum sp.]|nr:AAA domain-containing protein [Methanocorpusculum sp.]
MSFNDQKKKCQEWIDNLDSLATWSKFLTYVDQCKNTSAAPIIDHIYKNSIHSTGLVSTFILSYANSLIRDAMVERPVLARFVQTTHEQKILAFEKCDRDAISSNAKRAINILNAKLPKLYSQVSKNSEMGILIGEFNRKRGHMSIRTLLSKAGNLIQQIKPCFMMSPLSIAQYLDPRNIQFDIIIFDEASQVRPEDALGALLRGKQLVVMGDSQQLPPTTFFDQIANIELEDEKESVADITDMESLLTVCKQIYDTKRLQWHYRSRHESLISVSNKEFYDQTLQVFPSPIHDTPDLGLSFVYLPDTVYERGQTGINRGEAKQVAKAVIEYYQKYPNKSLGVATFSVRQQEAIRQEVELLLRNRPDIESRMNNNPNNENFFVKNIETIQGDERDTILISICYGFDVNHKLTKNFGPLNQIGGERRLNVMITRARERCVVFSNFKASDLNIDGTGYSKGLSALIHFLRYAENRNNPSLNDENMALSNDVEYNEDSSTIFSSMIAQLLEDNGYDVDLDVGCGGLKIDVAVKDPDNNGVYFAGISCDGPYYYSSEVARDRDRIRNQILKGLGWNIIQVWSTEWYHHPGACIRNLLNKLEIAKNNKNQVKVQGSSDYRVNG